jgi:hypothetical protein
MGTRDAGVGQQAVWNYASERFSARLRAWRGTS